MANPVYELLLTRDRLEGSWKIVDPGAGAVVEFWGVVRELEDGREIEGIEYEANTTMAKHQLEKIAKRAASIALVLFERVNLRCGCASRAGIARKPLPRVSGLSTN